MDRTTSTSMKDWIPFLGLFLYWFPLAIQSTNFVDLIEELGGDFSTSSLAAACGALISFFGTPYWGSLSDSLGRRTVVLICTAGQVCMYGLAAFTSSLPLFFLSRVIGGASSGLPPATQALIIDTTPQDQVSKKLGNMGAMTGVGFLVGVPLGGFIATNMGNHAPSVIAFAMSIANLAICYAFLVEPQRTTSQKTKKGSIIEELGVIFRRPFLRNLLLTRACQEIAQGILGNSWSEVQRSTLGLSAQSRGLIGMYMGALLTVIQTQIGTVSKMVGGPDRAITYGFASCLALAPLFYLASNVFQLVFLGSLWQVSSAVLLPLLNTKMSSECQPSEQGAILGASESTISLGAVLGPIITGYLLPVVPPLPFLLSCASFSIALGFFQAALSEKSKRKD